jgi:hypothetical protein
MSHQGGQIHADKNSLFLNPNNLRLSARRINLRPKWDFYTMNITACGGTFLTGLTRLTRFSLYPEHPVYPV